MKKIKILKKIKLTETERKELFERILKSVKALPESAGADLRYPVRSPFYKYTFFPHTAFMKAGVIAAFMLFLSSATTFASLPSLPGDLLYGLKINVVEKVAGLTARTPEQRAKIEAIHIEKRIVEFKTLAETGRLTEKASLVIEKNIDETLQSFDENVKEIEEAGDEETKVEVEEELESKLEKHKEKIIEILEEKNGPHEQALQAIIERAGDDSNKNDEPGNEEGAFLEEKGNLDGELDSEKPAEVTGLSTEIPSPEEEKPASETPVI